MDTSLKNKLTVIIVEKGLIALLILLAGGQVNKSLERYKLVEAQRVGDTSELVNACADIWGKVYEYEATLDEIDRLKSERWILRRFDIKGSQHYEKTIKQKESISEQMILAVDKHVTEKKFVIGDELARHFWQYTGLLKARAQAQEDSRGKTNNDFKKNSQEVVEVLDKRLAAMRFTAMAAREHAVSKLPR